MKEVLFHEGEGIDPSDFNAAQRILRAQMFDVVLGSQWRTGELGAGFPGAGSILWTFGGIPYVVGDANLTLTHAGGFFAFHDGTPWIPLPETPSLLPYLAENEEFKTVFDAGGANARRDLVCLSFEHVEDTPTNRDLEDEVTRVVTTESLDKRRHLAVTPIVVKGVEDGSEDEGAVPSGAVRWYSIRIPAAHASTLDPITHLMRNYLWPLGNEVHTIPPPLFQNEDFALGDRNTFFAAGAADEVLRIPLICGARGLHRAKLLKFGARLTLTNNSSAKVELGRWASTAGGQTFTVLQDISAAFKGANDSWAEYNFLQNDKHHWLNGREAGPEAWISSLDNNHEFLAVRITAGDNGDAVSCARVEYAV